MSSSLSSRMLVVYLGIPGIILAVYLGRYFFALFVTLVCLLALREFYLLTATKGISPQLWIGAISCVVISLFYYFGPALPLPFINPRDFLPLMMLIIVLSELTRGKENATANVMTTMGGIIYVPLLLGALIGIRQVDPFDYDMGMKLVGSLFVGIWTCDTSAYFCGKAWGKKKILERASPKKTVVGCVSGLAFALVFYVMIHSLGFYSSSRSFADVTLVDAVVFSVIVGVFGQAGDFIESLFKRDMGVKDSSNFLMGHGGVLDRFDSLIVASPLTFLYLKYFIY
ncbi:MAG: phosphatidate cytidylyltransferase [Candidatus Marinimicrobia bacterium]|nr:phosphatidate cytidylyltransferase [Candidatus Neomarinimicrobiota bacterium]MDP6836734.1 phosphatidate cytidylyltransferase [Candidatus Neomarinimicrobiota bacterium]MDP6966960.1 phosphatidate cytidylyltransferase [Candidatus Neomarinimicrobiota bacterium]